MRPADILDFQRYFMRLISKEQGVKLSLTPEAERSLLAYSFPDNIIVSAHLRTRLWLVALVAPCWGSRDGCCRTRLAAALCACVELCSCHSDGFAFLSALDGRPCTALQLIKQTAAWPPECLRHCTETGLNSSCSQLVSLLSPLQLLLTFAGTTLAGAGVHGAACCSASVTGGRQG